MDEQKEVDIDQQQEVPSSDLDQQQEVQEITTETSYELSDTATTTTTENSLDDLQEEIQEPTEHEKVILKIQELFKNLNLDDQVIEDRATAYEHGDSTFISGGRTYYIEGISFLTQNKQKFEQRIQKNNNLATEIREKHQSGLWAILKMYQCGFVPISSQKGRFGKIENTPQWLNTTSQKWNQATVDRILQTVQSDKIFLQKALQQNNQSLEISKTLVQEQLGILEDVEKNLKSGTISSMEELFKSYDSRLQGPISKLTQAVAGKVQKPNSNLLEVHQKTKEQLESDFKMYQTEVEKIHKEASDHLKHLDNQIDQAIKEGKSPKEIGKLKQTYKTQAETFIAQKNKTLMEFEEMGLKELTQVDKATLEHLNTHSPWAKKLLKANHGIDNVMNQKRAGKFGKLLLGATALTMIYEGASSKDRSKVGRDVADIGIGMIPIAGGAYDIAMAVRGVSLGGEKMKTSEIWMRAGFGVIGLIPGGGLLKGVLKGGEKALEVGSKTAKIIKTTEIVSHGAQLVGKIATYGYLGITLGVGLSTGAPIAYEYLKDKTYDLKDKLQERPVLTE